MNKILSDLFQNNAFKSLMNLILVLPALELQHQSVIVHDSVNALAKAKDLTFHPELIMFISPKGRAYYGFISLFQLSVALPVKLHDEIRLTVRPKQGIRNGSQ